MSKDKLKETTNQVKIDNNIQEKLDPGLKEVFKNGNNAIMCKNLSKEQIEQLKKNIDKEFNLELAVEEVSIKFPKKRVIFIDGNDELVYDDGEFYIEDTVDSKKDKKKLSKQKAMERYIEFFVRYTLNPLIEEKKIDSITKQIIKISDDREKVIRTKTEKIRQIKEAKKDIVR